jgi:hypothetical protein
MRICHYQASRRGFFLLDRRAEGSRSLRRKHHDLRQGHKKWIWRIFQRGMETSKDRLRIIAGIAIGFAAIIGIWLTGLLLAGLWPS